MSQHVFSTVDRNNIAVTITLGYDRPLDYVFCLVENEQGHKLYNNLSDRHAGIHQQDINYFRPILSRLGVEVPEEMFSQVVFDQANQVGNRFVDHTK